MSGARDGGERDGLAPVIPLFGGAHHARRDDGAAEDATAEDRTVGDADREGVTPFRDAPSTTWHTTWTDEQDSPEADAWDADTTTRAQDAEAALVKRLRTRSLSEREARAFLRERDLADDAIEHVLARMRGLGYLDDAALILVASRASHGARSKRDRSLLQALNQLDLSVERGPDKDPFRLLASPTQHLERHTDLDVHRHGLHGRTPRPATGAGAG